MRRGKKGKQLKNRKIVVVFPFCLKKADKAPVLEKEKSQEAENVQSKNELEWSFEFSDRKKLNFDFDRITLAFPE